jgi:sulfate adenylyltransferase subunit 2
MSKLSYLELLESESLSIIKEVLSKANNPVLMYSIGKDSSVLLHLILKAYYPNKPKLPILHIDTGWKFKEMIKFRNQVKKKYKLNLITYTNTEGMKNGINPLTYESKYYTKIMKTEALKNALKKYNFDFAIGGARRDEEKSRAKERIFSFRDKNFEWNPKNQRPELWNIFNTNIKQGETIRVFPLSNWTELDIWKYIKKEKIKIVSLYFAKKRKVIIKDNSIIMVNDDRIKNRTTQKIKKKIIRFRTLGCYPLTAAIESKAKNIEDVISEISKNKNSERSGRLIDLDEIGSMEKKKKEGYF